MAFGQAVSYSHQTLFVVVSPPPFPDMVKFSAPREPPSKPRSSAPFLPKAVDLAVYEKHVLGRIFSLFARFPLKLLTSRFRDVNFCHVISIGYKGHSVDLFDSPALGRMQPGSNYK
jgi:hypothetical protein